MLVQAPGQVPGLLFIRVFEPRSVENRKFHLDWEPDRRSRDEEVERAVSLGATIHEGRRGQRIAAGLSLRDPEGNEFCIEQQ